MEYSLPTVGPPKKAGKSKAKNSAAAAAAAASAAATAAPADADAHRHMPVNGTFDAPPVAFPGSPSITSAPPPPLPSGHPSAGAPAKKSGGGSKKNLVGREHICQHDSLCNEPRTTKDRGGGMHVFCARHKEEKQKAWREAAKRYRERKRLEVSWEQGQGEARRGGGGGGGAGGGALPPEFFQKGGGGNGEGIGGKRGAAGGHVSHYKPPTAIAQPLREQLQLQQQQETEQQQQQHHHQAQQHPPFAFPPPPMALPPPVVAGGPPPPQPLIASSPEELSNDTPSSAAAAPAGGEGAAALTSGIKPMLPHSHSGDSINDSTGGGAPPPPLPSLPTLDRPSSPRGDRSSHSTSSSSSSSSATSITTGTTPSSLPPYSPPAGISRAIAAWPLFWCQKEMMRFVPMETRQLIKKDFDNFSQGRPGFRAYAVQHRLSYELNAAPRRYRGKAGQGGLLGVKLWELEKFEWFDSLLKFLANEWWDVGVIMWCEEVRREEGGRERSRLEAYLREAGATIERRKAVLLSLMGSVHLRSYDWQEGVEEGEEEGGQGGREGGKGGGGPRFGQMCMVINIHGQGEVVFRKRKEGGKKEEVLRMPLKSGDVYCYTGEYRYGCEERVELDQELSPYRCFIAIRFWLPGREWLARVVRDEGEGGGFQGWRKLDKADKEREGRWGMEPGMVMVSPTYAGMARVMGEADSGAACGVAGGGGNGVGGGKKGGKKAVGEGKEGGGGEERECGGGEGGGERVKEVAAGAAVSSTTVPAASSVASKEEGGEGEGKKEVEEEEERKEAEEAQGAGMNVEAQADTKKDEEDKVKKEEHEGEGEEKEAQEGIKEEAQMVKEEEGKEGEDDLMQV